MMCASPNTYHQLLVTCLSLAVRIFFGDTEKKQCWIIYKLAKGEVNWFQLIINLKRICFHDNWANKHFFLLSAAQWGGQLDSHAKALTLKSTFSQTKFNNSQSECCFSSQLKQYQIYIGYGWGLQCRICFIVFFSQSFVKRLVFNSDGVGVVVGVIRELQTYWKLKIRIISRVISSTESQSERSECFYIFQFCLRLYYLMIQ